MLAVFGPRFGLDADMCIKLARGFGAGMHMGGVCGAVTGAFMVLGIAGPPVKGSKDKGAKATHGLLAEFVKRFEAKQGSIVCQELLGVNISSKQGWKEAKSASHFKKRCPGYVTTAAKILEELCP